jgi:hypothetical protein
MKVVACSPEKRFAGRRYSRYLRLTCCLALLALMMAGPAARAGSGEHDEYDSYKVRFDGFWFYSKPTGHFTSQGNTGLLDLSQDIGFKSYSSAVVKLDWKFTHKNHFYFIYTNFTQSKDVVLNRTINFQGQTFNIGATSTGSLDSRIYIPGYQYDFIRRKSFTFGAQVQLNISDISGSLFAAAQVNNGIPQATQFSSARVRVPLPVAGPKIRWYLIPNSGRLYVDANVLGMYFFGYGNYVSSIGTMGFSLTKHLAIQGGYSLGSRYEIKTKTDRVGMTLSQHGAVAGLEFSF